jgi:signal transduction histidine kinase
VATGEPFRSVYRFIAQDGRVVWVHGEAQVVRDDTGRPLFLQGVAFDITGIKQAEEDLKALNATLDQRVAQRTEMAEHRAQELVRSNAALGEYARVAAHDLSSPLLTIQGLIQRLENNHGDKLDDKARADIGRVVKAGVRMKTLIDDLLTYSKVRTEGKQPELVDCSSALEAACGNLGAAFDESGAEVTAEELPTVLADPTQLAQVFQNLIGNALKYRADRPPRIHVTARRDNPDWWAIDVADNGIGIDTNSLQKIFKLGIQSRLVSASVVPGSGIGLATCETIVQRHGGRIWATSSGPGKGTTISFTMPSSSGGKEGR